jgi:hypothetical protein
MEIKIIKTEVEAESRPLLAGYKCRMGPDTSIIGGCLTGYFCSCEGKGQLVKHTNYHKPFHLIWCESCGISTQKHLSNDLAEDEWIHLGGRISWEEWEDILKSGSLTR